MTSTILPDAAEIKALASEFEAAWATESVIYNGASATDDEAAAAVRACA